ncbi:solute carrier organic anion transporter family member 1A2 isoform X2 [Varanus komodoensis]|uniref:solute carrier organic anion transporter family member 1A2 isoform X2 n=1 Tax=Varanus komodoensis TaxID=61221 RepID=UPI001CF7CE89|nr:solute carrier organic anion transporter family member 1A2 isoform X2 [Varanus komodoensis]
MKGVKKPSIFSCITKLKVFLLALAFAYVAKTMSGAYVNSMLTQIERRFNIPASLVGVINGSFEMGNLLVIAFVSYLGAKLHRPRMIAIGCIVMALGCFLIGLPHFLMGRYQYENTISLAENSSRMSVCLANQSQVSTPAEQPSDQCKKQSGSSMWVFLLVGNIIRGVGETPITPLGISYVEDFAQTENSPFYIGCLQIATVLGPLFGLMIGSYCAQLYVDVGFIDPEDVMLSLTDARWVGAWWLGILICAAVNLLVAIPFCFLPKTLPKEGEENAVSPAAKKQDKKLLQAGSAGHAKVKMREIAKDFVPYLKSLFHNQVYMLFLCITVIQFSAWIGMITFMPKYLEQQYGISASDAIFLIGVYNLPIICLGYLFGGLMMKKFKISTYKAAHIGFWSSLIEYLIYFSAFFMICKNASVAGLTVSYEGSLKPEEKSFGVGLHALTERVFAGIPSPIYFGAMIDTACLKWGTKSCGGEGACRIYDSDTYRLLYLGLPAVLRGVSYIPCVFVLLILRKQSQNVTSENIELEVQEEGNGPIEPKDLSEAQTCTNLQHERVEALDGVNVAFTKD